MDATMRNRLIANGERIGMVIESYPLEVLIVGGNSRGPNSGPNTQQAPFRSFGHR
jgi:hypothetical protein